MIMVRDIPAARLLPLTFGSANLMRTTRRFPSSRPFMAAPRVDFYHPAREIDAALQAIERAVRRAEGIGLVVGPAGTGKSLLLAKLAEHLRDDFNVALLSGARICTRRALWQAVLADIGEPYRGLDEGELRINIVERIRGLAATGSGLVILVDEAHTLPTRLIEELRLLTTVPTPLPAVHIALAGTCELEEMLGAPKMEPIAQRIATRHYLEPLDHGETLSYLRTQARAAGQEWEALFEAGCDDAVYSVCDGVPRLINQLCDQALVVAAAAGRETATAADIATAWKDIQRLPPPAALSHVEVAAEPERYRESAPAPEPLNGSASELGGSPKLVPGSPLEPLDTCGGVGVIEFGDFDAAFCDDESVDPCDADTVIEGRPHEVAVEVTSHENDPIDGPDVELVFDASSDPFEELFDGEGRIERVLMTGPDNFQTNRHVASREGTAMAKELECFECEPTALAADKTPAVVISDAAAGSDDSDMIVIEEDILDHPSGGRRGIFPVRPGDYRRLFARLRCGSV
jgi:type II secretory pathway predicted ATPase ExeA